MSTFPQQHRAMHDAGPYSAAIHTGHHHGSHALHQPAALTGHYVPCPYEDKVITNGTTARMVLLFLRELLEQMPTGDLAPHQSYTCPMTKCNRSFVAPLQVIQHLLSCPEILNGEFDCDKCRTWHSFPTNEKDWAQWMGWGAPIQRKQSLSSKMKETFALRRKDPARKPSTVFDSHFKNPYATDTRPSTAVSETPSTTFAARAFGHHATFTGQAPGFSDFQKPMLPHAIPNVNGGMFWPELNGSDLPSTVSSVAISSMGEEGRSERFSQNTSQTTLFNNPGAGPHMPPPLAPTARDSSKALEAQHFVFPTQGPFGSGLTSLATHAPSISAMSIDEPLPVATAISPISPTELHQTAPDGSQAWWGPAKVDVGSPRPIATFPLQTAMEGMLPTGVGSDVSSPTSPCRDASSPYYPVPNGPTQSMSRALSHDSMHTAVTTVFGTPTPEAVTSGLGPGPGPGPLSPPPPPPHPQHGGSDSDSQTPSATTPLQQQPPPPLPQPHTHSTTLPPESSSVEDLVCDECQWKPRGVRENLKGYLRKHKNTHKGVRLACDVPGCVKTFSRLDNLKKHKKDKHGIEDLGGGGGVGGGGSGSVGVVPAVKRVVGGGGGGGGGGEVGEGVGVGTGQEGGPGPGEVRRPVTVESNEVRVPTDDYSMLWPALHF